MMLLQVLMMLLQLAFYDNTCVRLEVQPYKRKLMLNLANSQHH